MQQIQFIQPHGAYVKIPKRRRQFLFRFFIWLAEKITGNVLLPARVLLWYPKTLISSGVLEGLVAHHEKSLGRRLLKLVRMQASFSVSCPFCIDMNAFKHEKFDISDEEILALQGKLGLKQVNTFTERERVALEYARSASGSPLQFKRELIEQMKHHFSDRELVILASTIAQVNYWGRLIQAVGIPPAAPCCIWMNLLR